MQSFKLKDYIKLLSVLSYVENDMTDDTACNQIKIKIHFITYLMQINIH